MKKDSSSFPNLSWEQFRMINDARPDAFENMCRDLFQQEYVKAGTPLHSDPNHPGIEVAPVPSKDLKENGEPYYISFQAKHFYHTVNYANIKNSMTQVIENLNGPLDRIYLFCNLSISIKSKNYQLAKSSLTQRNIDLILVTDEEIFRLLRRYKDTASYYFFDRIRGHIPVTYTDDSESYVNAFQAPLFLETAINDNTPALLKDVYVPAEYISSHGTRENIYCLLQSYFSNQELPTENAVGIMILGQPGSGKSSFIAYLANELHNASSKQYYIIRLRNLRSSQINAEDPIQGLLEYLNIEEKDLIDSILVLDGLDEICALYSNTDFSVYVKMLLQNVSTIQNMKLVITSRTGYFSVDEQLEKSLYIIKIENWDDSNLREWSRSYSSKHPLLETTISENANYLIDEGHSNKKDIFAVPILFYMANARGESINKHDSISSIYDAVFTEVADRRNYDPAHYITSHKYISPKLARQICIEIAFSMFRCGRLNIIHDDDPYLEPIEVNTALHDAIDVCSEQPFSEISEDVKHRIRNTYALTFYYNSHDKKQNAVEFAHRTIAEYFTSEKILQVLCSFTDETNEADMCKTLSECFGYEPITPDIFRFLYYKVRTPSMNASLTPIKLALTRFLVNASLNGKLFNAPEKHTSNMHLLDRVSVMMKSVLMLFEYLECTPPKPSFLERSLFNNLIACISGLITINPQHFSLLPFALNGFDLSEALFANAQLRGAHLSQANLSKAILPEAILWEADLSGANLFQADLSKVDLSEANLSKANLSYAHLADSVLNKCNIESANFQEAYLLRTNMSDIDVSKGAIFTRAYCREAIFSDSYFTDVSFDDANMTESKLDGCIFVGCHFKNAVLYKAYFKDTDISKADISGASFISQFDRDVLEQMKISDVDMTQNQYNFLSQHSHIHLKKCNIVDSPYAEDRCHNRSEITLDDLKSGRYYIYHSMEDLGTEDDK